MIVNASIEQKEKSCQVHCMSVDGKQRRQGATSAWTCCCNTTQRSRCLISHFVDFCIRTLCVKTKTIYFVVVVAAVVVLRVFFHWFFILCSIFIFNSANCSRSTPFRPNMRFTYYCRFFILISFFFHPHSASILSRVRQWSAFRTHGHINMVCVCVFVCIYCFRYFVRCFFYLRREKKSPIHLKFLLLFLAILSSPYSFAPSIFFGIDVFFDANDWCASSSYALTEWQW